jgi:hypothetical protein
LFCSVLFCLFVWFVGSVCLFEPVCLFVCHLFVRLFVRLLVS